jgi:hypothetical protein
MISTAPVIYREEIAAVCGQLAILKKMLKNGKIFCD